MIHSTTDYLVRIYWDLWLPRFRVAINSTNLYNILPVFFFFLWSSEDLNPNFVRDYDFSFSQWWVVVYDKGILGLCCMKREEGLNGLLVTTTP